MKNTKLEAIRALTAALEEECAAREAAQNAYAVLHGDMEALRRREHQPEWAAELVNELRGFERSIERTANALGDGPAGQEMKRVASELADVVSRFDERWPPF